MCEAHVRHVCGTGERLPQEMATHLVAGDEVVARPLGEDPSVEEHVRAVAERERFANVVVGDQDADAARAKIEQDAVERLNHQRVNGI